MNLKRYHAYTMAEALAAVKRDLGEDAVILHTRTFKRGGIFGIMRRTIVEVTATPAERNASPAQREGNPSRVRLKGAAAQRAYGKAANASTARSGAESVSPSNQSLTDEDRERTRRLALALEEAHRRREAERSASFVETKSTPGAKSPGVSVQTPPTAESALDSSPIMAVASAPKASAAKRFLLTSPEKASRIDLAERNAQSFAIAPMNSPVSQAVQDELGAIKELVGQVLQRQATSNGQLTPAMPKQLFDMYLKLIGQEIGDELADQIVNEVRDELSIEKLEDENAVRSSVLAHLAKFISVADEALTAANSDGRPLTIALVGPTGVGKTTTLAKLAATFKLRQHKKVGLITADTYRIAAVDQLRTYAEIIGLPMEVALTPTEMKRAIAALSANDVILIDTAGRSQNDASRIDELKRFLVAANPHEVHLVLSSTAGEKVLLQEAQAFAEVGVHKIVLTKLDEAVSFGMLVNVIRQVGKQLSFFTTGQEVPEDIEVGRAERLAELVLGGSVSA